MGRIHAAHIGNAGENDDGFTTDALSSEATPKVIYCPCPCFSSSSDDDDAQTTFQKLFHSPPAQDFGLVESAGHIVALVCCIMIGYALLPKDAYSLSVSTPESISYMKDFDHLRFSFEEIDHWAKFESWFTQMVDVHYKPARDPPFEEPTNPAEDWMDCPKVMRPMNNYSVNLVGGVVVTVHRGTVNNGNFKENAELYGQEYVRAMQERLKTEGPGSLARLAPKNASFTNREVLVDEGLQALARANIRGLESDPDQLLRFTQQDYSELDVAFPYGRGFYYLFDPKWTREEAAIALRELLASPYFKEDTRMIQVSLWYSADTWASVDIAVLFSVEISQNGFCFPHWGFRAIPIHSLKIADVCILVLYGVWGTQALVQVWKIMRLCCLRMCCSLYMTNVWNWWDWINFATFLLFSLRYYQIHRETQTWHPSAAGDCYMTSIAHVQVHVWQKVRTSYFTQFGIMMAITCWRSLKYLQLSPVLLVPKLALSRGGSEILAMLIVFMIMTLGFGWLFHVKYYMHPEFSSVTSSCLSLLCIITQTLDPDQFFSEDGFGKDYTKEGKLMAAVFTFVCSFILLNIFIGIMTCHYVSVQEQYG